MPSFDPIKFEVIRNTLVEATEEMAIALRRSAYSTNIKTRADFSCALFDRHLRPVAQAFAQPNHLGSLGKSVPRVIQTYGPENLGPGDAILANDPYLRGVHLNDVTLISPIYTGDELLGYVASLAHHVDMGGGAPASIGAFQEVYLVNDSDGPGRRRGGLGLRRDYLFPDHDVSFTVLADRERWGPWGLFGGQAGERASYVLMSGSQETEPGSKVTVQLTPGQVMSYRTCGGGGYGPPSERDPALVLRDVREGKISPARARDIYKVAVNLTTWAVDEVETVRLRQAKT